MRYKPFIPFALAAVWILEASAWAGAQGRPDLVWMAGGHTAGIRDVVYSPDGKLMASCATSDIGYFAFSPETVEVWRVADMRLIRTFTAGGQSYGVAFSPDSTLIALASNDSTAHVWRISDGSLLHTLPGTGGAVYSVAFSPDGAIVAVGDEMKTIRLWSTASGTLANTLSGHKGGVVGISFSSDGQSMASISRDPSNDGRHLIVWNASSWTARYEQNFPGDAPIRGCIAFSPDSNVVAMARSGGPVYLLRTSDGTLIGTLPGGRVATFSPDGATLASYDPVHGGLGVWRIADGVRLSLITPDMLITAIAYSPDGSTLATGERDNHVIRWWHAPDGARMPDLCQQGRTNSLAVSPDGTMTATVGPLEGGGTLAVRRTADGSVLNVIDPSPAGSNVFTSCAFSADGRLLAGSYSGSSTAARVDIWDVETWELVRSLATPNIVADMAFSRDGTYLAGGNVDGTLRLWHLPDWTSIDIAAGARIYTVAFSPDGKTIASGGTDGKLWDTSGRLLRTLSGLGPYVLSIAFSPDGQTLATGSAGNGANLRLWNVADGALLREWQGDPNSRGVTAVTFSPDGEVLLSAEQGLWYRSVSDGTLLRYDPVDAFFDGAPRRVLAYSPNGKYVLYGRGDGPLCAALNPFGAGIHPSHGGNTGNVTVKVITSLDFPLADGATVTLTGNGFAPIAPISSKVESPYVMTATFDLRGAPLGKRDVVVSSSGAGERTYAQGFTVETGTTANLSVEVVGRKVIRGGQPTELRVLLGNSGNVDLHDLVALISYPSIVSASIGCPRFRPEEIGLTWPFEVDWCTLPVSTPVSGGATTPIWVLSHAASSFSTMDVTVTSSASAHSVNTVLDADYGTSPESLFSETGDPQYTSTSPVAGVIAHSMANATGNDDGPSVQQMQDRLRDVVTRWFNPFAHHDPIPGGPQGVLGGIGTFFGHLGAEIGTGIGDIIETGEFALGSGAKGVAAITRANRAHFAFDAETVTAGDPNDLSGPTGYGPEKWLPGSRPVTYDVMFENVPTATAPAATVVVTDHIDATKLDTTSVQILSISFAGHTVTPTAEYALPVGQREFNFDEPMPEKGLICRVYCKLDMLTGDLTWTFTSIDPNTGLPIDDATKGFLAPGEEGSCLFSVLPKPDLATGTVVSNQASIKFDYNDWMETPTWSNTIDNDIPTSTVLKLTPTQKTSKFTVKWAGADVGSGLKDYTVSVSTDNGPFEAWQANTAATSAAFTGVGGHSYRFYSVARDNAGNVEAVPDVPDAATTVVLCVDNVKISPNPVAGSLPATGTVTLTGPPSADALVALTSSNPAVASVPASVTIAAGTTTATFPVTTTAIASTTTVTISATWNGIKKTTQLKVRPIAPATLTFNPTSVKPLKTTVGTVTLEAPAAPGDVKVTLSSSPSILTVPLSITIPQGATTGTFSAQAGTTTTAVTAKVTASTAGGSKTVSIKVLANGVASLVLSPNTVQGGTDSTATITLDAPSAASTTVALTTSNASVAWFVDGSGTPIASVTIPAGQQSAHVKVRTATVSVSAKVTLKAVANGVGKSAALTIKP